MRYLSKDSFFGRPGTNDSPHVLIPELLRWFKGSKIAQAAGTGPPIECGCKICDGQTLGRFTTKSGAHRHTAERHAITNWMPWAEALSAAKTAEAKHEWWRSMCSSALAAASAWQREHGDKIPDSPQLRFWAQD